MRSDVLDLAARLLRGAVKQRRGLPPRTTRRGIPLRGVRALVSERMGASAHATARVTLVREVDASGLVALRRCFRQRDIEVEFNDILVHCCASALLEHPAANARLGVGKIEVLDEAHIGLAVDSARGLFVPIVRNADSKTISEIAAETRRLAEAAHSGRFLPDELDGGTFTLTNLGMFGVEAFTPIINLPECCILGVGRIIRKPVVVDDHDTIGVRRMMALSLVFDHRVIDGAPAARFLDTIARLVSEPALLLTA